MNLFKNRSKKPVDDNRDFVLWQAQEQKEIKEVLMEESHLYHLPILPKALPGQGKIIAVQGVIGGDGATTLAVNLAAILAMFSPEKVVLVDMDGYGCVRSRLGLPAGECLVNILDWEDIHGVRDIAKGLISHSSDMMVVPGVIHYDQVGEVRPSLIFKMLTLLKENYHFVVVDCSPVAINNNTWATVLVADVILTVVRPDRSSLDMYPENNGLLSRLGCQQRAFTVLNQAGIPGGIRTGDLRSNMGLNPLEILPYSVRVAENNNRRQLIVQMNQRDDYVKSLETLVERILS